MTYRRYEPKRDREDVARIWREVGWIDDEKHDKALDVFLKSGSSSVAELEGAAECMVNTDPGTLRYLDEEIATCCVTGVTTSRIARKRGFATGLLTEALSRAAAEGAKLAALGVFDQGFYDRLGFGSAGYERWCTFDPAQLAVDRRARTPVRLAIDDWESVHQSRLARHRAHGAISILSPELTRAEMMWTDGGFGLGYASEEGELTHHLWLSSKEVEAGPYRVNWMAYRTREQFLELLALIKEQEDQVHTVQMHEPGDVQIQDLLRQPFKMRRITRKSQHEHRMTASAYWQARILDLEGCLSQTRLNSKPLLFGLELRDPIDGHLPADAAWHGIGGDYTITLGRDSSAEPGRTADLPVLRASVGAFTRMWLGVRPASGLSWTDDLEGPPELLGELDRALRLPAPSSDWDF
jgi:GNAT superfamily N-acetyltransferase